MSQGRHDEDQRWMAQMRRGSLELCLLAILSRGTRYGYDIVQALAGSEGFVIKEGTIYPLLSRLRNEGLIDAEWRHSTGGPDRKYYTLTNSGRDRLTVLRRQWEQFSAAVAAVLEGSPANGGSEQQ